MIGPLRWRRVVGLSLGGASSVAVLAKRHGRQDGAKLLSVAEAPSVSFQGALPGDLDAIVKSLAIRLGRDARRADTPAAIALPDPLFREDRLSFAEAPDKPAALNALIKWRIAREHRLKAADIVAACQRLPGDGDAEYLVRFAQKATIDAVEAAARRAGLTPTLIEAQSRFQALTGAAKGATAVVTLSEQWWMLNYRDAASPEGHVRSDWRSPGSPEDLADLSAGLTRLIRTMSRNQSGLAVTVSAPEKEASSLIDSLRTRLANDGAVEPAPPCDGRVVALQAAAA